MADEKLNSLDRFRKQSDRLVLEQHSHCEVPAGCGGVVLRWRNPFVALPLLVHLYAPGKSSLWLDGEPVVRTGNNVAPGEHVFAFVLEDADLSAGLFMFAAIHDQRSKQMPPGVSESSWRLISAADRSWLATTEPPIDRATKWTDLAYDDGDWRPLVHFAESPQTAYGDPHHFRASVCNRSSAAFLALPPATAGRGSVWVRRRFVVPGPQRSE